jgi:hypothetical protein
MCEVARDRYLVQLHSMSEFPTSHAQCFLEQCNATIEIKKVVAGDNAPPFLILASWTSDPLEFTKDMKRSMTMRTGNTNRFSRSCFQILGIASVCAYSCNSSEVARWQ